MRVVDAVRAKAALAEVCEVEEGLDEEERRPLGVLGSRPSDLVEQRDKVDLWLVLLRAFSLLVLGSNSTDSNDEATEYGVVAKRGVEDHPRET